MKFTATLIIGLLIAGCDQAYGVNDSSRTDVPQSVRPLYLGGDDADADVGRFLYFVR